MNNCMFIGTHDAVLDEKSRLIMPAPFRKDNTAETLEGDFFVTPHFRGYLFVRPQSVWKEYIQAIQEDGELSAKDKRAFIKQLYNNSTKLKLDSQYRLVLNQKIRAMLLFTTEAPRQDVKMIGCGSHLEIWPASSYQGEDKSVAELSRFIDRFEGF